MFAFDTDWLNRNSFRNFPIKENCTLRDISDSVTIPQNLVVDLVLATPAVDERFYIQTIAHTGNSMSLVIADSTDTPVADVTLAIPLINLPYTSALIEPVGGSTVFTGRIVVNTDGVEALLLWPAGMTFTFNLASSEIEPGCLFPVPIDRVLSAGKLSDPTVLVGDVKFKEGYNIRLERVDDDNAIQISAIEGAGLGPICKDQCEGETGTAACTPICTINGVGPDENGNVALNGLNTVLVTEADHTITIDSLIQMAQLCAISSSNAGGPAGKDGSNLKINIEKCGEPCPPENEAFEVGADGIIIAGCCGIDITKDLCGNIPRINFGINIRVCNLTNDEELVQNMDILSCTTTVDAIVGLSFDMIDYISGCCIANQGGCPPAGAGNDPCAEGNPANGLQPPGACDGDDRCEYRISAIKKRMFLPTPVFTAGVDDCTSENVSWVSGIGEPECVTVGDHVRISYPLNYKGLPSILRDDSTGTSTNEAITGITLVKDLDTCQYKLSVTTSPINGGTGGAVTLTADNSTATQDLADGDSVVTDLAVTETTPGNWTVTASRKTYTALPTCGEAVLPDFMDTGDAIRVCLKDNMGDGFRDAGLTETLWVVSSLCSVDDTTSWGMIISYMSLTFSGGILYYTSSAANPTMDCNALVL
jgi:hypothetical protein